MAWTTPKENWQVAELVTVAAMNVIRDNLNCLGDHLSWSTFNEIGGTPLLWIVGSTGPNLGNAASGKITSGSYMRVGNLIHASVYIKFGTSGVSAGNGVYTVNLPVAMSSAVTGTVGSGAIYDNSGDDTHLIVAEKQASYTAKLRYTTTGSTETWVTHAAPFAWAASDQIHLNFVYEVP